MNGENRARDALRRSRELNGDVMPEDNMRTLTDADVEAILAAFEKRFYLNLGKGVWSHLWKIIMAGAFGLAGYGALKGWWK